MSGDPTDGDDRGSDLGLALARLVELQKRRRAVMTDLEALALTADHPATACLVQAVVQHLAARDLQTGRRSPAC
jgi:hypothetical protein